MRLSLVAAATLAVMLAACSSTPKQTAESQPVVKPSSSAPVAPPVAQARPVDTAQLERERLAAQQRQQLADLNAKSVFFDFDSFVVKQDNAALLQSQSALLQAMPADHLTLQGNADERGGAEYNLALGQKRAEAVRKALVLLGASGDRIEAISFGKEKPRATCHDESCWSQNRRVDFVNAAR
jgi:peptidoglycan-associated lipoprotein